MLADDLISRREKTDALRVRLADNPSDKAAGGWISEIAKLAWNRREERHVAIVQTVRKLRRKIALLENQEDPTARLTKQRAVLQKRVDGMKLGDPGWERYNRKLAIYDGRLAADEAAATAMRLKAMFRRLNDLVISPELLTKEDVING